MQVYVGDTIFGLSAKTRRVDVVDVRHVGVAEIEYRTDCAMPLTRHVVRSQAVALIPAT
jgi:hypothetical protein